MTRKGSLIALAFLMLWPLALYSPSPASADGSGSAPISSYSHKWLVVPYGGAPAIDGSLSPGEWDSFPINDFSTVFEQKPSASDSSFAVSYDANYLYIGGSFDKVVKAITERLEIVLAKGSDGEAHYVLPVPITPTTPITVTDWNMGRQLSKTTPQRFTVGNATSSVNDTATRTVVEIAVPWSSLASSMPAGGEEWRLNIVHIYHLGTSPLAAWAPLETSNFIDQGGTKTVKANLVDEGRFGSLYFGQVPAGTAEQGSGVQLDYVSPTRKRLSFDRIDSSLSELQLEWKGPAGSWKPLAIDSHSYAGGRDTLVFDHPDTDAFGQYQLRLHRYEPGQPGGGKLSHIVTDRDSIIRAGIQAQLDLYPTPTVQSVTYAPPSQQVLDLIDLIPPSNGFRFTGLPEMPELHPDALYTLSADKKSLISTKTSTVYPNPSYPETGSITVSTRSGGTVTYPYYEDSSGKRYFLTAHLWYLQKAYVLGQLQQLSKTDPMGAAHVLNALLQAFDQYVPTTDYIWENYPINLTSGPPFNYWGGLWGRWSVSDLSSLSPVSVAFGNVRKTDALAQLSSIHGYDLEQRLLDELFIPSIDFVLSFPKALGNMNYTQWLGLIDAGKALNEPDYLHMAFEWMQAYTEMEFLSDGFWKEVTVSYHKQSIDGLDRAVDALNGHSDPDGYLSPRTGRRFDQLNMADDYPIIDKALRNNDLLVYPNGHVLPVMDTWANEKSAKPITGEGSFLMPTTKIARTASGSGAGQTQAWLQFVPKYGHNHYDPLNLNYYALGQELLPDLGYTYTKDRYFTLSTIGHNTVVVNSSNMAINNNSRNGGNIELFAPLGDAQVVRAEQSAGYNAASEYRREPWHITFPGAPNGEGYLLDLFRVEGGTRHEYTLNGDANRDALFVTDLELEPYGDYLLPPGVTVVEPTGFNESGSAQGHYYGYISINDVEKAVLPENADTFRVTLQTSENGTDKARMNIIGVLDDGSNELYLARSPSIRSTRLSGKALDTNDEAVKYDMPKLVLRRDGTQLQSTFITAMEPYAASAAPKIRTVDRLQLDSAPNGAVAVQVTYDNVTDIIISNTGSPDTPIVFDDIVMKGKTSFIRMIDQQVTQMVVVGGTALTKGSITVNGDGTVQGAITATKRKAAGDGFDGLVTSTVIPAGVAASLSGKYVVVKHPDQSTESFLIREVTTGSGGSTIVFEEHDPGFTIAGDGSSRQLFIPHASWTGTHTFQIDTVAGYEADPVSAVTLTSDKTYYLPGEPVQLAIAGTTRSGSPFGGVFHEVRYKSSDESVFAVGSDGTVSAVGSGIADITAVVDWNGRTYTDRITLVSQSSGSETFSFNNLPITSQTVPTLYVAGSDTVQLEANTPGESITFAFDAAKSDTYDIRFTPFVARSYGQYDVAVDGSPLGSYEFYASTGAAISTFELLGTRYLTEGTHTITFTNTGKHASSTNYKMGVRQLKLQESRLQPPALTAPGTPLRIGDAVTFTFADSPAWRSEVDGVYVGDTLLTPGQYTLSAGSLTLAPSAFDEPGSKLVRVIAGGYREALGMVKLYDGTDLAGLSLDTAPLVPAFRPDRYRYEAGVGSSSASASVTAAAIDGSSTITSGSLSATSTLTVPLALAAGANAVTLQNAKGGSASAYAVDVFRAYEPDALPFTVTGVVYEQRTIPVAGAIVTIPGTSLTATTDVYGQFQLYGVGPGQRRLAVSHPAKGSALSPLAQIESQTNTVTANVYYPFVDIVPPTVSLTGPALLTVGSSVYAQADEPAALYIVPETTPATAEAIRGAVTSGAGKQANAAENVSTELSTLGLEYGRYRVYAIDEGHNVSTNSYAVTLLPVMSGYIDHTNSLFTYHGTWTSYSSSSYHGGTMVLNRIAGSYAEIPFYGSRATWIGSRNAAYGLADVYMDDVFQETVNLYNPTLISKQTLYDTGVLTPGIHTMKIVVKGQRISPATNDHVSVDALHMIDPGHSAPVVSGVSAASLQAGTGLTATSSDNGTLYLVPSSTQATWAKIDQATQRTGLNKYGVKVAAQANVPATLDTTNLAQDRYVVYAVSDIGIVSAASAAIDIVATTSTLIDDTNPLITYYGNITANSSSSYYGGTERIGREAGAYFETEFYGNRAIVYGTLASNGGLVDVYLDDQYVMTYDYYRAGTGVTQSQIWDTGTLTPGLHKVKFVVTGNKHPSSQNIWLRFDYMRTYTP
ncbi:hemoblobin-interacting domain-containing protein [Paenibacillus oceani]|uniref:DUF1533 domain-containing protein n=1 Tax=Paenibacillus oceani TaxID=2772510 RepID=A0A927H1U8_9BACL|nr:hemoblobin-interacting domain-containing protein [Paenibacillus oceani]MBD2864708.1 DUF1533 domain-containing protein [Paenibacillus oceani]